MLRNSLPILLALCIWASSSALTTLSAPETSQLTDMLDLLGEAIFIGGLLLIFARLAIGIVRPNRERRSLN